jgi:cytoskeleton protein RodZ
VTDLASFGETLRQARKARNISLQEIAESTKIGTRILQALEDERFDQLPGGIFNKGFVRSYARCVGLNEEKTVAAYMAAANVAAPETDMQMLSSQVSAARAKQPSEPWWSFSAATVAGIVALMVALGVGGLWLKEHRKDAREQAAAQHQAQAPAVSTAPVASIPTETPTAASDPNAAQSANQTPNQTLAQNAVPVAPQTAASSPSASPTSTAASAASTGVNSASQQSAAPVEVSISATARSWISVRSDGKSVETLTLDPEKPELSTRSYKAQERLKLIVGNPAGISVTYNGKPEGALGADGHKTTVTFTPLGIEKQ